MIETVTKREPGGPNTRRGPELTDNLIFGLSIGLQAQASTRKKRGGEPSSRSGTGDRRE